MAFVPVFTLLKFASGALLLSTIALGGTLIFKNIEIDNLKNKAGKLELKIGQQELQIKGCKDNFELLSNSVDKLKNETKLFKDLLDNISPALEKIDKNTDIVVDNILKSPTPTTCNEAIQYLRDRTGAFNG